MLNKNERKILEYVLDEIKKVREFMLYENEQFTETYTVKRSEWETDGTYKEVEEERECLNFDTINKLREDMENPLDQLKKLLDGGFQYKANSEQAMKRWHYLQGKEAEKAEQIKKEGVVEFMEEKAGKVQLAVMKKESKAFQEGRQEGKEHATLTEFEILKKARMLETGMTIGYHAELKEQMEEYEKKLKSKKP
jgi:hypothetical protein